MLSQGDRAVQKRCMYFDFLKRLSQAVQGNLGPLISVQAKEHTRKFPSLIIATTALHSHSCSLKLNVKFLHLPFMVRMLDKHSRASRTRGRIPSQAAPPSCTKCITYPAWASVPIIKFIIWFYNRLLVCAFMSQKRINIELHGHTAYVFTARPTVPTWHNILTL